MTRMLSYVELDVPEFASPDGLDPMLSYDFTVNSLFGWTGGAATATATANGATLAATGADPVFRSPAGLTIDGAANRYLRIDVERTAIRTAGAWQGAVFYTHGGHGESASFMKTFAELPNVVGAREVYLLDMGDLDAGGGDWITNIITQIRIDLDDASPGGTCLIRSVSAGSLSDGREVRLDGGTYMTRGASLTGAADSKQWTFSVWLKLLSSGSGTRRLVENDGAGESTRLVIVSDNSLEITGGNSAGTLILRTASGALPLDEWVHVMGSVDLSDPEKNHLYVNGVSDLTVATFTDDTMDFTKTNWAVGASTNGSDKFTGDVADLWFAPGVYIDLSAVENRRKFISDLGNPVDLGAIGELPTGAPPLIFMTGPAAGWQLNKGAGGGFTVNGSPADLLDPGPVTETFRFAVPTSYLPRDIEAIPSIENIDFQPATLSLGQNLGQRASLNISFKDHLHRFNGEPFDQGTFWGKWRGRYGTKLRARDVRLIRGEVGQDIADMDVRYYTIDTTDGPSFDATYTVKAKDLLKLADDDRAQAPTLSNGSLSGSISAVAVSATLTPLGIGNQEYATSGWVCVGGKEVCSFTRAADVLTITRAQFGTVATTHDAGDRVQTVLRYAGNDPADIIYDLMVNYAAVPAARIDLAAWRAETSAYLNVIYAATITEPTSVNKLVSELIEQAALAVWWDDRARTVGLQVLREISTDSDTFDHERILEGSFSVKEQPAKRISQIWTYYGQRDPTDSGANEDNYRAALATVDLERETDYGSAEIKKIQARWVETLTAANRLNSIQISRFRDPPRSFAFDLFRDQNIVLAGGYQVSWWGSQDETGVEVPVLIQVTRVTLYPDRLHVEAEEMLASGTVVLVNVVFLLTAGVNLTFTVPTTWNDADNSIHTIGGGEGGQTSSEAFSTAGAGGGGGAYSSIVNANLTPGAVLTYRVGIGGGPGVAGGDTWFNGASLATSTVGAKGGAGGIGGAAASGVGTTRYSGGDGALGGSGGSANGGGGGGGAAGPHGDGADGSAGQRGGAGEGGGGGGADAGFDGGASGDRKPGGNNRFNFGGGNIGQLSGDEGGGGAGGGSNIEGGGGGAGEQIWTQTVTPITSAGPGGGGGGGGRATNGGDGGLFGGGGAGAGEANGAATGGDGAQGLIVIINRDI